jgi:hypothetical protein
MKRPPTNRLAQSPTYKLRIILHLYLSLSFTQACSCYNHTTTAKNATLTMPSADLTSCVPSSQPTGDHTAAASRQKSRTHRHASPNNRMQLDQQPPNDSGAPQLAAQLAPRLSDRQPQVSILTPQTPNPLTNRISNRKVAPIHRPKQHPSHIRQSRKISNSSRRSSAAIETLKSQPRSSPLNFEWTAASHLHLGSRKYESQKKKEEQQWIATNNIVILKPNASRHRNPNRNTNLPSPIKNHDRKHRTTVAKTHQNKSKTPLPPSHLQCSLHCLSSPSPLPNPSASLVPNAFLPSTASSTVAPAEIRCSRYLSTVATNSTTPGVPRRSRYLTLATSSSTDHPRQCKSRRYQDHFKGSNEPRHSRIEPR